MTITLHIDRLVLDGLPVAPHDVAALRGAIEQALTDRVNEQIAQATGGADALTAELMPDLAAGGAVASLSGGTLRYHAGTGARQLGTDIGRAIHGATFRGVR